MKISENDLLDFLPFGVALIQKDLKLRLANNKFTELTGMQQDASLRTSDSRFANTDVILNIKRVFETGEESVQYVSGGPNEIRTDYNVATFIPLFGTNGEIKEVLCIFHGTTESGHWQKEFNILFEKVPCYISIVDKNLKVLRANERYRDTFGESHSIFNTEQSKKRGYEYMTSPTVLAFSEGMEQIGAQVGVTKSGEKAHLMISTIPIAKNQDGVSHVMEIAADITELNQLQEQLHHAHDFYSDLIESSADGIVALTHRGKVQIFNAAARNMLKWDIPRKPGIPKIQELMPKEFFEDYDEDGSIISNKEFNIVATDGTEIPVRMNAFIIRTKKSVMGRVAFLQDLRKIKELEYEKMMLEQDAVSTTFLSLEANIDALLLEQNRYLDDYENLRNSAPKEVLDKAWANLRSKFDIKNKIIDIFVTVAKGYQIKLQNQNINKIIEEVYAEFKDIASSQNVTINLNFSGNLEKVKTDKYALYSLLQILISNGIDAASFSGKNGRLELAVGIDKDKLLIEIVDNGSVIPKESLDNYFKIKESRETRLGLLTASMITELLKGKIIAQSSTQMGNSFRVELPI
jgi:histidine kinase